MPPRRDGADRRFGIDRLAAHSVTVEPGQHIRDRKKVLLNWSAIRDETREPVGIRVSTHDDDGFVGTALRRAEMPDP